MISVPLMWTAFLAPFFIFLMHVIGCRLRPTDRFHQLFLIRLILFLNVPVLVWVYGLAGYENRSGTETLSMMFFAAVVWNGFGYAYFHLFNLSETGRRVKFLIMIRRGGNTPERLAKDYSPEDMVRARIKRLETLRAIHPLPTGGWGTGKGTLLFAALALRAWRKLYGWKEDA